MKKLASILTLSVALAGCGVTSPSITSQAPVAKSAASVATPQTPAVALPAALVDPDLQKPVAGVGPVDPTVTALEAAQAIAKIGPMVTDLKSLNAEDTPEAGSYAVQTRPERTQAKADIDAHAWASDAKQMWLGWGFKTISLFGNSRHVYFSASKKRLLTIEYGFFGNKRTQYESSGLVVEYAGKLISFLLQEPRDVYPVSGRDAYNIVTRYGYDYATRGTIKVIMLHPILLGPQWIFFNAENKPSLLVDANTGEVRDGGIYLEILGYLFDV